MAVKMKNKAARKNSISQTPKWEDMSGLLSEILGYYGNNYALLSNLIDTYKANIENDQELTEIIKGIVFSYEDISKDIRFAMEKHITFEYMVFSNYEITDIKNGKVNYAQVLAEHPNFNSEVSRKTGKININTDEYFDYINLMGLYIDIQDRLINMNTYTYINIFTKLKAYGSEEVDTVIKQMEQVKETSSLMNQVVKQITGQVNGK